MKPGNYDRKFLTDDLINGFIASEIQLFKTEFDEPMIPYVQDQRGLAIAWTSYFFKESISDNNRSEISRIVYEVMQRENYAYHGWLRIPAIQAASFILTNNTYHRDVLLQNIACGQASNRIFIIQCAAILASLLEFDNEVLKKAAEANLKFSHDGFEQSTILFLVSQGNAIEKIGWINQMITKYPFQVEFLKTIMQGYRLYENGFFIRVFNQVKSYFIFKIFGSPQLLSYQPNLFSPTSYDFKSLLKKEKGHPLNDFYIDFSFLKSGEEL